MISVHSSRDRIKKRAEGITSDPTHPRHKLPSPLSGRHYRALHTNTPNNSCELLTHEGPFIHQNRLILVVATVYLSSLSCLCENNVHMCYVWTHELAQMHQILMKHQINPCTLPAAGQFWLHWWCRNRWRQCCRHAQPGGADCFGTCPSSWCAGISGGQVPPLPIKKNVLN